MTAAEINSVIDNLCQIFGVTVDRLVVEMSRAHIAYNLTAILACVAVILPWIVALIVAVGKYGGIKGFIKYTDYNGGAAIVSVVGVGIVVLATMILLTYIPDLVQWMVSPFGSTVEVIVGAIGG